MISFLIKNVDNRPFKSDRYNYSNKPPATYKEFNKYFFTVNGMSTGTYRGLPLWSDGKQNKDVNFDWLNERANDRQVLGELFLKHQAM